MTSPGGLGLKGGIGRQISLVVIGDSINFASGVILSMILARVLPVEGMGTYRQIMYLGPMAVALAELGVSSTVYRFWNALEYDQRLCYVKMVVVSSLGLGALTSVLLGLLAPLLSGWYHNPDLKTALLITAAYPLATIPISLLRPALLSQGYSIGATSLEMVFSVTSMLALLIPLWAGLKLTPALAIWMTVSLIRLSAIPLFLKDYLFQGQSWWNGAIFREVWQYLWPMQVARIPGYVTGYLDKVVMSIFLSTQAFAVYSLGAREIPFIGMIGWSVASVLLPSLVEDVQAKRHDQLCRRWRLACERTAIVTYLVAAFCIWHAVPVMQFMFSATYSESSVPFRVFAALTFVRVIEYGSLAKALNRSQIIMKSAFIGAGTMVVLSFALTWALGVLGMALAVFFASVAAATYFLIHYKWLLKTPLAEFFPWPRLLLLLGIALASIAGAEVLIGSRMALEQDTALLALGWKLGVLFAVSGMIYLLLLVISGFIKLPEVITAYTQRMKCPKKS